MGLDVKRVILSVFGKAKMLGKGIFESKRRGGNLGLCFDRVFMGKRDQLGFLFVSWDLDCFQAERLIFDD